MEDGADHAVTAREALPQTRSAAAQQHLGGLITVAEAAAPRGRYPETLPRAVRKAALPDGRTKARGRHSIR